MTTESQLSLQHASELLGWSQVHLRRLIKSGELRKASSGGMVLWEDVRRLALEAHRIAYMTNNGEMTEGSPPPLPAASTEMRPEDFEANRVLQTNVLDGLRALPSGLVQCAVTSPPYWGVRRYADDQTATWADGTTVAFGQEKWPEDYVRHTLEILRLMRRVVRPDGVVWWNIGDTYMTRSHVRMDSSERLDALEGRR